MMNATNSSCEQDLQSTSCRKRRKRTKELRKLVKIKPFKATLICRMLLIIGFIYLFNLTNINLIAPTKQIQINSDINSNISPLNTISTLSPTTILHKHSSISDKNSVVVTTPTYQQTSSSLVTNTTQATSNNLKLNTSVELLNHQQLKFGRDENETNAPNQQGAANKLRRATSGGSVCRIKDGESVAIVEIEESRDSGTNQRTNPVDLPISGSVELGEIELKIESETHKYFELVGKSLRLTRPLDRDATLKENNSSQQIDQQQAITSIYLQISCLDKRQTSDTVTATTTTARKKSIIPILVKVLDINDNAPKFTQSIYTIQVNELAPVGTIVLDQLAYAIDLDSASNGQIEYSLISASSLALNSDKNQHEVVEHQHASTSTSQQQNARLIQTRTLHLTSGENTAKQLAATAEVLSSTEAPTTTTPASESTTTTSGSSTSTISESSSSPAPPPHRSTPTINLDSEPIVNEPMDESEEDESDEALLAELNRSSTNSSSDDSDDLSGVLMLTPPAHESIRLTQDGRRAAATRRLRRRTRREAREQVALASSTSSTLAWPQTSTTTVPTTLNSANDTPSSLPWTNLLLVSTGDTSDAQQAPQQVGARLVQSLANSPALALDSGEFFTLELAPQSNRPVLRLRKQLDYETRRVHELTLVATDRALDKSARLSSRAKILVRVLDGDDQGPAFVLDQLGCATGVVPRATTPLPAADLLESDDLFSQRDERKVLSADNNGAKLVRRPQLGGGGGQLERFRASDDNLDFGDTLALDDSPPDVSRARLADYSCLVQPKQYSNNNNNQQAAHVAEYFATIISGDSDYLLRIFPQSIKARDRDELNAPIKYSFVNGTPGTYATHFSINPLDASIKQIQPVDRQQVSEFIIYIQAQEQSYNKLSSVARLTIDVLASDKSPPVLVPNSYVGIVSENSPQGKRVLTASGLEYLKINVIEQQQQQQHDNKSTTTARQAAIAYEFESTSDAFKVDSNGFVYVNKFPLDRDAPNQATHMIQVTGQLVSSSSASKLASAGNPTSASLRSLVSSPISLNITLLDENDNAPMLLNSSLGPLQVVANTLGGTQTIGELRALDLDEPGPNSRVHFALVHVSNGGRHKFRVDEESGLVQALGKFSAGEQYSLTVQASDELQRISQAIVEVHVTPGINSGGPQFVVTPASVSGADASNDLSSSAAAASSLRDNSRGYSIEVNEAAPIQSVILQVRAVDPENDPITYSIIDGNANGDFVLHSRTGTLRVANKLDREEISAYKLIVQARDSGGLATSRPIYITITDSNDQNPIFTQDQYDFSLVEGVPASENNESTTPIWVGRVTASDSDDADNGRVSYSLVELEPRDSGNANLNLNFTHSHAHFTINSTTGDVWAVRALDYELVRTHTLLVVARDAGEHPRSSSATIRVRVLDQQDEMPFFEHFYLETSVVENKASARLAQVQARDLDSVAEITYVLLAGDQNLFQVDPRTGVVRTSSHMGLDFEQARLHTLLVGTNETMAAQSTSTDQAVGEWAQQIAEQLAAAAGGVSAAAFRAPIVRVDVRVLDENDEAPQFESAHLLPPVRVHDSAPVGSALLDDSKQLRAFDRDGSAPNNLVRYELVTRDHNVASSKLGMITKQNDDEDQRLRPAVTSDACAQLFAIDSLSGQLTVKTDLRRRGELSAMSRNNQQSECQLLIRAHDLPVEPNATLSSTVTLTVFIDRLVDMSPNSLLAFADSSYTLELSENSPANSLVKVLPVLNKANVVFPLVCELLTPGNELGHFYVHTSESGDCELRTKDSQLDYEQQNKFELLVKLSTIGASGSSKSQQQQHHEQQQQQHATRARIQVNIVDRNDNRPAFSRPQRYAHLTHGRHLAAVASDAPSDTQVIQMRATDADSSLANGLISYELLNQLELDNRFKVDPVDGIVRTSRPVEDVPASRLPLRLQVMARDNPVDTSEPSLSATTELLVNIIDDQHRLVLVLRDTPVQRVIEHREQLLAVLQERTGLIAGLERVESLKQQRNSTAPIEFDSSGTDVWFHLVEPTTFRLIPSDDTRLRSTLFEARGQNSLADIVSETLAFAPQVSVRLPLNVINALNGGSSITGGAQSSTSGWLVFGAVRAEASERLAPVLISLAMLIAIISMIVVVYQCGSVAALAGSTARRTAPSAMGVVGQQLVDATLHSSSSLSSSSCPFVGNQEQKFLYPHVSPFVGTDFVTAGAQQHQQFGELSMMPPPPHHREPSLVVGDSTASAAAAAAAQLKEYETQMLKMAILFDDNQSFDEHNQSKSKQLGQ